MGVVLSRLWRLLGRSLSSKVATSAQAPTNIKSAESVESCPSQSSTSSANSFIHIAIVGSGIGGLSLAVGCLRNNVSFTIYESAAQYSVIGAGVGLGPNALRAMALISPELRGLYDTISSGNLSQDKLHVAMEALYAEPGFGSNRGWTPQPFGAPCYERTSAHRRDLLNILTSQIPANVVQFNKRVTEIQQFPDEGRVVLSFADGTTATATAVIGCDGVKGVSRGVVLSPAGHPEEVAPVFSGKYAYRSIVPMATAERLLGDYAGDAKCFNGPNVNVMTYPISSGTECNIVACKFTDAPWMHPQWTHRVTEEAVRADFSNVDERLVTLITCAEPVQWALHHHIQTSIYYHGLVCLLGDSAHATTPHQASGASMSIEDALILSHVLGVVNDWKELSAAFAAYDAVRRPRAQRIVRTSQELGAIYACQDPHYGEDMGKIVKNLNERFLWIWEHDLGADMKSVRSIFKEKKSEA
ncbi:hypothetical protein SEUCBS139899_005583 [Sporothrix eucalyptigena]|uniref:FAD-binding domain-containing protein n=1 Tax=Sporothrix eucalyptigena TaxID=1812306 RepID=A0ABP0C195_9PEZI